tara:strand:+ start:30 stop:311 length:282 start_codon:yes stop_codon:yes gene_type:complete
MKTVNVQELIIENKKISLDELGNKLINLYIDRNNLTPDQTQKKRVTEVLNNYVSNLTSSAGKEYVMKLDYNLGNLKLEIETIFEKNSGGRKIN